MFLRAVEQMRKMNMWVFDIVNDMVALCGVLRMQK